MQGILPVRRSLLSGDVVAGVTLAALAIPEVMGYTTLAGMPVVTGLYTILLPLAVYAVLGSSRHLVVGADSASAVLLAAGIGGLAATASPQYVGLAGIVALMAAGMLILARLARLGFIADFLSRTVLVGFLTGVGIQVAAGQLAGMLGVGAGSGGTLEKLWNTLENVPDASGATVAVSVSVLVVLLGTKYVTKAVPGALIAVVGSIVVSWAIDLQSHGVAVLGAVPRGLPPIGLPSAAGWTDHTATLVATAFSIFVVILAQSAATSRAYAARYGDRFSEDADLVGLGAANVAAGLSGTFVVNGSPTKTQMVDSAGGHSQIAGLTAAGVVLVVLLFLTRPLQYMPEAVLSSVVFLIGIELVKLRSLRSIWRVRPDEFAVAVATAAVVVVVGVEEGIVLAIVLSLVDHLRRSYKPNAALLTRRRDGHWKAHPFSSDAIVEAAPGLVVYRFAAGLYYANASRFADEVRAIAAKADPPLACLCLDASVIADVDFSAAATLRELHEELAEKGSRLVVADVLPEVRTELERLGVADLVGADAFYDTVDDAAAACREGSAT